MAKKAGSKSIDTQVVGVPLRSGPPSKRSGKPNAKGAGKSSGAGWDKSGPQRLQRILASAGYGSRRQCEELIKDGRVEVEGMAVVELGAQVDPQATKIFVDGNLLKQQKLVYFLLNKPPGVVTSNKDPQGRTLVVDLIQEPERVFPVGRLDRNSEGLLLLTNDGDLAQQLAHPKYGVRKIYRVTVAGKIDNEKLVRMKKGIYIAEGHVAVDGAKILRHRAKSTELEIVLREGKNREIRRILARLGHKVMSLQRVAIGPLRMGELPRGLYRPLKADELRRLREEVFYQSRAAKDRRPGDDGQSTPDDLEGEGDEDHARKPPRKKSAKRPTGADRKLDGARKDPPRKGGFSKRKTSAAPQGSGGFELNLEGSKRLGTVIGDEVKPSKPKRSDSSKSVQRASDRKTGGKKRVVLKRSGKRSSGGVVSGEQSVSDSAKKPLRKGLKKAAKKGTQNPANKAIKKRRKE